MFKKRKENLSMYVYVLHEGLINFVVVQWTSKKCTKKRDAPAELGPVPERPISINPGLKFRSVFVFYIPMHCLR